MIYRTLIIYLSLALPLFSASGCSSTYLKSIGGGSSSVLERTYLTDFNTAWQSVLEALKNVQLDVTNKEGGFIQTKWIDNTNEKNFIELFGDSATYLKAQYRLKLSLETGKHEGKPSIRVKVLKEQFIQRDVLEGWRPADAETVEETTLLYRIGRIVLLLNKLTEAEEQKAKEEIENSQY